MKIHIMNIKTYSTLILSLYSISFYSLAANYDVKIGENTKLETESFRLTVDNMSSRATSRSDWGSAIAILNTSGMPTNCNNNSYIGTTVIDGRRGYRIANGVILVITGSISGTQKAYASEYNMSTKPFNITLNWLSDSSNYSDSYNWNTSGGVCAFYLPQGTTTERAFISNSVYSDVNVTYYVYASSSATPGTYTIPTLRWGKHADGQTSRLFITTGKTVNIIRPRSCTVSTDNTITFPAVDITDAANGKALANKTGNFTITCDDTTNAPVNVEIQGTKGTDADAMALMMTGGGTAPAEVRGFIGPTISLSRICTARKSGSQGVVSFVPNAGLEKMPLKPGTHKYNWVLCSTGVYKTGKATGSAKMVVSWD